MFVDPKSPIPIFRQIADQLKQAVDAGVHKPGEMLPSQRVLAIEIKVNPNTIQRAYEALEREGVVETRRGIGVFVVQSSRRKLSEAESRLRDKYEAAILQALKAGVAPAAARTIFEELLRKVFTGVNK
ncbi:GntR family transcriptional regulator [Pirellulaceae bacterium SH449]